VELTGSPFEKDIPDSLFYFVMGIKQITCQAWKHNSIKAEKPDGD